MVLGPAIKGFPLKEIQVYPDIGMVSGQRRESAQKRLSELSDRLAEMQALHFDILTPRPWQTQQKIRLTEGVCHACSVITWVRVKSSLGVPNSINPPSLPGMVAP